LITIGCSQIPDSHLDTGNRKSTQATTELTVSAASSLTDVLKSLKPIYEQEHPDVNIIYNLSGSGTLQKQIEQGAPVDIFISAAERHMDELVNQGLILEGTNQPLLQNRIALIVPQDNNTINSFADLTSSKTSNLAVGEPESVPAGKYAQETLKSLKIYDQVKTKLVYAKDVRQVFAYVVTKNSDAGMVYQTDVAISDQVKIVSIAPESSHSPIIYPIGVIKSTPYPDLAQNFVAFLTSETAQQLFTEYGFIVFSNARNNKN
jgi:molybdate transport system substrate-binding protein